ncbi:hypothetical protein ACFX15_000860 [Malus domestica]
MAGGGRRGSTGSRRVAGDDVDLPCTFLRQLFDPLGRRGRLDSRPGLLARPFDQHGPTSRFVLFGHDRFFPGRSSGNCLRLSQRPTT